MARKNPPPPKSGGNWVWDGISWIFKSDKKGCLSAILIVALILAIAIMTPLAIVL